MKMMTMMMKMTKMLLFISGLSVCLQVQPVVAVEVELSDILRNVQAGIPVLKTLFDYGVGIEMTIENWSKFPLSGVVVTTEWGQVQEAPNIIRGGMAEFLAAHKTSHAAAGSCGVVSWLIERINRRLVVMWSAPYSFNFYSNYLAVGLTNTSTKHNDNWFDHMYDDKDLVTDLRFKRKKFEQISELLFDKDPRFQIHALMGTSHMSKVRVVLRPKDKVDLAPSIMRYY